MITESDPYGHYKSLFGCIGQQDISCDCYFLVFFVQLIWLVFMPLIVYFMVMA